MSFFFFLILCVGFFNDVISDELERPNRIVGGEPVNPGDIPWQVSLQRVSNKAKKTSHFCGGALIKKFWVLTAAHCTDGIDYSNVIAVTGAWSLKKQNSEFRILKIFRNNYSSSNLENDIALLKLDINPLKTSSETNRSKVLPIPLEEHLEVNKKNCLVSGWGRLAYEGEMPDILHAGKVSLLTDEECRSAIAERSLKAIYRTNVCAGGNLVDTCQGDSGGPLVCCEESSPPDVVSCQLTGVTSWGISCGVPGLPGIYTEVAYYGNWINEVIQEEDNAYWTLN